MLTSLRATQLRHDNRLDQIDRSAADREGDLRTLRDEVAELGTKITSVDDRFVALDGKVTALDAKLDRVIGLVEH